MKVQTNEYVERNWVLYFSNGRLVVTSPMHGLVPTLCKWPVDMMIVHPEDRDPLCRRFRNFVILHALTKIAYS